MFSKSQVYCCSDIAASVEEQYSEFKKHLCGLLGTVAVVGIGSGMAVPYILNGSRIGFGLLAISAYGIMLNRRMLRRVVQGSKATDGWNNTINNREEFHAGEQQEQYRTVKMSRFLSSHDARLKTVALTTCLSLILCVGGAWKLADKFTHGHAPRRSVVSASQVEMGKQ
jgi:hypothetical protein